MKLDLLLITFDPSPIRLFILLTIILVLVLSSEGFNRNTLGTFRVVAFPIHRVVDVLDVPCNHWIHILHQMLSQFTLRVDTVYV